ncbi:MAG: hypothetical protein WCB36_07545 [Burkholderiales bacterium]
MAQVYSGASVAPKKNAIAAGSTSASSKKPFKNKYKFCASASALRSGLIGWMAQTCILQFAGLQARIPHKFLHEG